MSFVRSRFGIFTAMGAIVTLTVLITGALAAAQAEAPSVPSPVRRIFISHCVECHSGSSPSAGMSLEPSRLPASILNRVSSGKPEFKIADTAAPERSYLLMKLRGAAGIAGSRMPLRANKLTDAEIQTLSDWLAVLKPQAGGAVEAKKKPDQPAFQGVSLANLPTDTPIEGGHFQFRIAHRFFPAVDSGRRTFFGLDGPGAILLGFGYGLSDRLSVTLGRTNQFQEWDLAFHYRALAATEDLPFGLALHAGTSLTTAAYPGRTVFSSPNFRAHVELSLSGRLSDRISLLVVPAFVSNPDQRDPGGRGTFALGLGGRWMFLDEIAFIAEWIPVLSGYRAGANSWSFGLEKKIGGHVFQIFILNAVGSTPGQYLPGPDLRDQDTHPRIGFNIYRTF
jgi:mono/diheme cytochrome c family protein